MSPTKPKPNSRAPKEWFRPKCFPPICLSNISVPLALWWHCRVPRPIITVVVDGPLLSHPEEPAVLVAVEVLELFLVPPPAALCGAELGLGRGLATVDVEAAVGGDERSVGPVGLLKPTPCGPVIGIPEAGIELHGLFEWEPHPQVLAVLEHPDGDVVHKETGPCKEENMSQSDMFIAFLGLQKYGPIGPLHAWQAET